MSTNYSGNSTATQSPSPAPGVGYVPIFTLPNDGDPLNAASIAQALKAGADGLAWIASYVKGLGALGYGTGLDGPGSIASDIFATGEKNYDSLTISAGSLNMNGHVLRVKNTLTINDGALGVLNVGVPASGGSLGTPDGNYAYWWAGRSGAAGNNTSANGAAAASLTDKLSFGGKGGAGGHTSSSSFTGGAGGLSTIDHIGFGATVGTGDTYSTTTPLGIAQQDGGVDICRKAGSEQWRQRLIGGMGGGAGGSDSGSMAGAGGGGGGPLIVFAKHIVVGPLAGVHDVVWSAAYSPFCAEGGRGGTGAGTSGGGGGGGGGAVIIVCSDWSGVALTSQCIRGGVRGNFGSGTSGVNGNPGNWAVIPVS